MSKNKPHELFGFPKWKYAKIKQMIRNGYSFAEIIKRTDATLIQISKIVYNMYFELFDKNELKENKVVNFQTQEIFWKDRKEHFNNPIYRPEDLQGWERQKFYTWSEWVGEINLIKI